jgi:hypothetical protein
VVCETGGGPKGPPLFFLRVSLGALKPAWSIS